MTARSPKLLAASVVIAASLLGGCSDHLLVGSGEAPMPPATEQPAPPFPALDGAPLASVQPPVSFRAVEQVAQSASAPSLPQAARPVPAVMPATISPASSGDQPDRRLASNALDDRDLAQVRGGFAANSGVVLNFAFQQATFIDHNLAQTIVVPTLTISPGQGGASVAGASPMTGLSTPNVNVSSLTGLGVSAQSQSAITGAKVLPNGTVQTQVSVAAPVIQSLVNSGMASVVSSFGNGGLSSVITNTASNRVVQQSTTIDLGVSGLSSLMRQSIPATVMNRLSGPNLLR